MRLLALAALVGTLASSAAPLDEYFGVFKMSALRIRYEIMQLRPRYETHKLLPEQAEHLALLTQVAFDQWAQRYPHDPWLASTGFAFARLYEELPGKTAQAHAVDLLVYVKTNFPNTAYAAQSRSDLHRGVPVRADPSWAAPMRAAQAAARATPSPASSPSPAATTLKKNPSPGP